MRGSRALPDLAIRGGISLYLSLPLVLIVSVSTFVQKQHANVDSAQNVRLAGAPTLEFMSFLHPVNGQPSPGPGDTIIFEDDFETGNLSAWNETPARYAIETDPRRVHTGLYSVRGSVSAGVDGQLNKWFMPGYDEIFAKFSVLFEPGYVDGGMHFVVLFGNRVDNRWSGSGQAGIKPNGSDYFYVGIDPEYPSQHGDVKDLWPLMLYAYWPDMDCPADYDRTHKPNCYGNYLVQSNPKVSTTAGVWHEVVIHLSMNTPGLRNGSETLWIDAKKKYEKLNVRFRDTTQLRLNQFSIQLYATTPPKTEHVWFDDVQIWAPGNVPALPLR